MEINPLVDPLVDSGYDTGNAAIHEGVDSGILHRSIVRNRLNYMRQSIITSGRLSSVEMFLVYRIAVA